MIGSVLREDFHPKSDLDVLVEFESDARVGFIRLRHMPDAGRELTHLLLSLPA